MTFNDYVAALGMCRFPFFVFFVLTYFRYSCYRIDEAVGAEKRLLPRAIEKLELAVARAGRCCGLAKCSPAGTRTTHFDRPHYRTALGRQGKSPSNAKTMTAAAWSVEVDSGIVISIAATLHLSLSAQH